LPQAISDAIMSLMGDVTQGGTIVADFESGLSAVRCANPAVTLAIARDPALPGQSVLSVEYPSPTADPAGRDIWCDASIRDWSAEPAIWFRVRPHQALKLSVSFFDRNRVAYSTWFELQAGVWQPVRVVFEQLRPNPYFQRPDAKVGAVIDVTDVRAIAFAPHDPLAGRLAVSRFVISN